MNYLLWHATHANRGNGFTANYSYYGNSFVNGEGHGSPANNGIWTTDCYGGGFLDGSGEGR